MNRIRRMMWMAVISSLLFGINGSVFAQTSDQSQAIDEIRRSQEELRKEVESLRKELQGLRNDLKKVSAQMKAQPSPRPRRQPDTTVYDIDVSHSPVLGPKDAPVTITEFVCLQCPFCVREYPVLQQVMKQYPNDVRLVFKHFPLTRHTKAPPAHAAVALAYKQKGDEGAWQMIDLIMKDALKRDPKALDPARLRSHAEKMGLDLDEFDRVLADPAEMNKLVLADKTEARKVNVSATPTILINGLKLTDRKPEGYKARIDEILKKMKTDKSAGAPPASLEPKSGG